MTLPNAQAAAEPITRQCHYSPQLAIAKPRGYLRSSSMTMPSPSKRRVSPRTRKRSRIPQWYANLRLKPAKSARLRGRVQLAAQRVLYLYGTATTSDVIDYAHALRLVIQQEKRHNWLAFGARRALESIGAKRVGRASTTGRPWQWSMDASMGKNGKAGNT